MVRRITTSLVIAVVLVLAVGGSAADAGSGRLLIRAKTAAALAPLPGGGLVYGELTSGRIWRVSADGRRSRRPVARVSVSANGLRGLLGLAVDSRGRVFADWTGMDHRIHVAQVAPGPRRAIWSPGADADEANVRRTTDGLAEARSRCTRRSPNRTPVAARPRAAARSPSQPGLDDVQPSHALWQLSFRRGIATVLRAVGGGLGPRPRRS